MTGLERLGAWVCHGGLVVAVDRAAPKDEQERQQAINDELDGESR